MTPSQFLNLKKMTVTDVNAATDYASHYVINTARHAPNATIVPDAASTTA